MSKTCTMEELLSALTEDLSPQEILSADITSSIANAITKRRMALGLNQKQLAEKFGRSQSAISKWENGDLNYSVELLAEIAVGLDLELRVKLSPHEPIVKSGGYRTAKSKAASFLPRHAVAYNSNEFELEKMKG